MMAILRKSAVSRQTLYRRRAHERTCRHAAGDGLRHYHYDSQGRLQSARTGQGEDAPTTRYAHNALGQRVFKTDPLYAAASSSGSSGSKQAEGHPLDDEQPDPGLLQTLLNFFTRLWSPAKSDAEHLGWVYLYDEEGSLLGEYGMGGAASAGQSQFLYLPTAQGPIPMAAEIDSRLYAIHTDHMGTPRRLTQADGQPAWQWAYTPYGDEAPTLGAQRFTNETTNPTTGATNIPPVRFNLRYPGQYFDEESGLHYNWHRSYDPKTGRYTQGDPIGLEGRWNRFAYVGGNPLGLIDPLGLKAEMCYRPIQGYIIPGQHCFARFNGNDNDTLSFDPTGVGPDPSPKGATCEKAKGPEDDDCVKREMTKCQNYHFTKNNCCHCVEQALKACGQSIPWKKWPNWPINPGPQPGEPGYKP